MALPLALSLALALAPHARPILPPTQPPVPRTCPRAALQWSVSARRVSAEQQMTAAQQHMSWVRPWVRKSRVATALVPSTVTEDELSYALRTLVRKTASHTVSGRGRDWRGVFDRLDRSPRDGSLGAHELQMAVSQIAGPNEVGDYESVIRRFDSDGDGKLNYADFEAMLKTLLRIPHDKVMLRSSPVAQPERYTTESIWFSSLANIGGSQVLRGIFKPLLAVAITSGAIACIQMMTGNLPGGRAGKSLVGVHSLLGGALSLLLVFRTNSAYNRFWEARRIWESVLNRCRDLARFVHLYRGEAGSRRCDFLVALLCAYPRELRSHLVGAESANVANSYATSSSLQGAYDDGTASGAPPFFSGAAEVGCPAPRIGGDSERLSPPLPSALSDRLRRAGNRPLYVCKWLASELRAIPDSETFSSRERLLAVSQVNQLSSYVGACERLLQTPVPLNYARHTSRFLTLWCLTLPISLVDAMGLLVIPVTAFVTWCLFGIQEIGLFIEHCALDDGAIFMDTITELVALDVLEAVEEEEPLPLEDGESYWSP